MSYQYSTHVMEYYLYSFILYSVCIYTCTKCNINVYKCTITCTTHMSSINVYKCTITCTTHTCMSSINVYKMVVLMFIYCLSCDLWPMREIMRHMIEH